MKIYRTADAAVVNAIMSDAFGTPMDFTTQAADPGNFAIVGEHGCMLFGYSKPGIYALTMGIREEGKGAWANKFVREVLAYMFTETDAKRLWSMVVKENKHVIALAAQAPGIKIEHNNTHSFASVTKEDWHARAA